MSTSTLKNQLELHSTFRASFQKVNINTIQTAGMVNWIPLKDSIEQTFKNQENFTVLSYNLLAQCLIKRDLFPYCDRDTLRWKTRSTRMIDEFQTLNPDIGCLQEVGNFKDFFQAQFTKLGYSAVYNNHPTKLHGCCIVFKSDKFECVSQTYLDLDNTYTHEDVIAPRSTFTGNIGIILVLRLKADASKELVVSTTHLYWRPDCDYERLRQIFILTKEVQKFALGHNKDTPVLICGDFNSQPYKFPYKAITHYQPFDKEMFDNMGSDLEQMFVEFTEELAGLDTDIKNKLDLLDSLKSSLEASSDKITSISLGLKKMESRSAELKEALDRKSSLLSPQNLYEAVLKNPQLISVYRNYSQYDKTYLLDNWESLGILEPKYTHFTADFRFTLDYIFQLANHVGLTPTHLLRLPDPETFGPGLPSSLYPSDHLPIMARFEWLNSD